MLIEQDSISKKDKRTTSTRDSKWTIARNQYWYYRTFKSNGMDTIVVIIDRFTKMTRLKAMTTNILSEGIAKIYQDDIWKLHKIPRKILSDREPQFSSKFMEEFTKVLGTKWQLLMAYHPQTDGQTERINQEIGIFL